MPVADPAFIPRAQIEDLGTSLPERFIAWRVAGVVRKNPVVHPRLLRWLQAPSHQPERARSVPDICRGYKRSATPGTCTP